MRAQVLMPFAVDASVLSSRVLPDVDGPINNRIDDV
jgi:hypothetical protein